MRLNEYNQELLLVREELSLGGDCLPVQLRWTYHSYPAAQNSDRFYGNHWSFSYQICLRYDAEEDAFLYDRDDGSRIVFKKTKWTNNNWTCWREVSDTGLLYQLWLPTGSTDVSQAVMKTIYGTYQSFDSEGRIIRVAEIVYPDNDIEITYFNGQNCIHTITDAEGRIYRFSYNRRDQLASITCQDANGTPIYFSTESGKRIPLSLEYNYDIWGNLIQIKYPDGECVKYQYARAGKLDQVQTIDEREFAVQYDGKQVEEVEQIAHDGTKENRKTVVAFEKLPNDVIKKVDEIGNVTITRYNSVGMQIPDSSVSAVAEPKRTADAKSTLDLTHVVQAVMGDFAVLDNGAPEPQLKIGLPSSSVNLSQENLPQWMPLQLSHESSQNEKASTGRYEFDQNTGLLLQEWHGKEKATQYQYDAAQKLTRVSLELSELNHMVMENRYLYEKDRLQSISRNDTTYELLYDIWGNNTGVEVNGRPFISYTYQAGNPNLIRMESYGNGQSIRYRYTEDNRLAGVSLDSGKSEVFSYDYGNKQGQSFVLLRNALDETQTELYEDKIFVFDQNSGAILYSMEVLDNCSLKLMIGDQQYCLSWDYSEGIEEEGQKTTLTFQGDKVSLNIQTIQDVQERIHSILISSSKNNESLDTQIFYQSESNALVTRYLSEYTSTTGTVLTDWQYAYDDQGRICNVLKDGNLFCSFYYDAAGQLTRADDAIAEKTTLYQYDIGGNLIQRQEYAYTNCRNPEHVLDTATYSYENAQWKDQLTVYNGKQILYDEIGNPVQYDGKQFQWSAGRRLRQYTDDIYRITYTYDQNGLRQHKVIADRDTDLPVMEYHYYWNGDLPAGFTVTEYQDSGTVTDSVCYAFGDDGTIYGFLVNGVDAYLYERNAQGDVTGIYHDGEQVAAYTYDPYGRMTTVNESEKELSKLNLFYYRGYSMDRETGLYYLKSRYYVPEWGRFLNADIYVDTGTGLNGTNLFAYCNNDPVNQIDPNGHWGLSVHEELTQQYLQDNGSAEVQEVIDGNWSLDRIYPAWVAIYRNQKFHFDRRNDLIFQSDEDTRLEQAALNLQTSVNAAKNDINDMDIYYYLGRATHSMQDYSAHGNIGLDNRVVASHAGYSVVDDPNYDWVNNTDRGRSGVSGCVKEVEKDDDPRLRYNEALEYTASCIMTWMIMMPSI